MGRQGHAPTSTRPSAPPGRYCWRIVYTDLEGTTTARRIRFDKLQDRRRCVVAWCELRGEERTFYLDSCIVIQDVYAGRTVVDLTARPKIDDLEAWLTEYRRSRRTRRL